MSGVEQNVEQRAVTRRAGVVAAGVLTSRVLGLLRMSVIAAYFGKAATDAFFVAFTIPNALRVLMGEGAVSGAFIPVFTEVKEKHGMDRAREFLARLLGALMLVLTLVSGAGVWGAEWLVGLYAGGFDEARFELTVTLTRAVFPYIFFMGLMALATGALNSLKRFFVPAFAPSMLNVSMIVCAVAAVGVVSRAGFPPISALVLGALVGGVLQVLVHIPSLRREGILVRPRFNLSDPFVRKAFALMVPLLAGLGVYQLNILLSRRFASGLPEGAQSYLTYAQRLVELPQGLFAFAIASAALPTLAALRATGNETEVKATFSYGLRLSLFVAIPSTVAMVVIAEPVVAVLFGRGNFGAVEITETAHALIAYGVGIWAVASIRTVLPLFHAYNDTRTPVVSSAVNLAVFVSTCVLTLDSFAHVGIAAANSVASVCQLAVLLVLLRRKVGPLGLRRVFLNATKMLIAALVMGATVAVCCQLGQWERGGNDAVNLVVFAGAVLIGAVTYAGATRILGCPELGDVLAAVRRRR